MLKAILLFFISLSFILNTQAQSAKHNNLDDSIYFFVDVMPVFGGDIDQYISQRINYPEKALRKKIKGVVSVDYVITKEGYVSNVKVKSKLGYGCDEEAMRVIKELPPYLSPAMVNGQPVNMINTMEIHFQLKNPQDTLKRERKDYQFDTKAEAGYDLKKYADKNLRTPKEVLYEGVTGKVFAEFVVNEDGTISEVFIIRGLCRGCDKEVKRFIQSLPPFKSPAKLNGELVKSYSTLIIGFKKN